MFDLSDLPELPDDDAITTHAAMVRANWRELHDHPWEDATSLILHGGYTEEREADGGLPRSYVRGDVNKIKAGEFHRIASVLPDTWTLFDAGPRVDDWGFLVGGVKVPHLQYFEERGYKYEGVKS